VILIELDGSTVEKAYIYANGQIIAQHDGAPATDNKYFYLHDRLGSVRQIINYADSQVNVKNRYTYKPFGELFEKPGEDETEENVTNSFKFTGQYYDSEIGQYYLRARQYDPYLARFSARDPVRGKFQHPLTVHMYLYCLNDPINLIDPSGAAFESLSLMMGTRRQFLAYYARILDVMIDNSDVTGMTAVEGLAQMVEVTASFHCGRNDNERAFMEDLAYIFTEISGRWGGPGEGPVQGINFGQSGFAARFTEPQFPNSNQVRHFVGWALAGYYWERVAASTRLYMAEHPYGGTRTRADYLLGIEAITFGIDISWGPLGTDLRDADDWIREHLAE